MTLGDHLNQNLQPGRVTTEQEHHNATVDIVEVDRLGTRIERIHVTGSGTTIQDAAARIPEACRTLPDRILPIEVDPGLGGAIFRSDPRDIRDGYFEAHTNGRSATIERIGLKNGERSPIPFTLTREQLGRLVDDLAEALSE